MPTIDSKLDLDLDLVEYTRVENIPAPVELSIEHLQDKVGGIESAIETVGKAKEDEEPVRKPDENTRQGERSGKLPDEQMSEDDRPGTKLDEKAKEDIGPKTTADARSSGNVESGQAPIKTPEAITLRRPSTPKISNQTLFIPLLNRSDKPRIRQLKGPSASAATTKTAIHLFPSTSPAEQKLESVRPDIEEKRLSATLQVVRSRNSVYEIIWEDKTVAKDEVRHHPVNDLGIFERTIRDVEGVETRLAAWSWDSSDGPRLRNDLGGSEVSGMTDTTTTTTQHSVPDDVDHETPRMDTRQSNGLATRRRDESEHTGSGPVVRSEAAIHALNLPVDFERAPLGLLEASTVVPIDVLHHPSDSKGTKPEPPAPSRQITETKDTKDKGKADPSSPPRPTFSPPRMTSPPRIISPTSPPLTPSLAFPTHESWQPHSSLDVQRVAESNLNDAPPAVGTFVSGLKSGLHSLSVLESRS